MCRWRAGLSVADGEEGVKKENEAGERGWEGEAKEDNEINQEIQRIFRRGRAGRHSLRKRTRAVSCSGQGGASQYALSASFSVRTRGSAKPR